MTMSEWTLAIFFETIKRTPLSKFVMTKTPMANKKIPDVVWPLIIRNNANGSQMSAVPTTGIMETIPVMSAHEKDWSIPQIK